MKTSSQILAVVFQIFLFLSGLQAQDAPCLKINGDTWTTTCPTDQVPTFSLPSNIASFQLMQPTEGLENNPDVRYKAFWIFGDGNFRYFPDGLLAADLQTHTQSYSYAQAATYEPVVLLSEKKSNTTPPRKPKRSISRQSAGSQVDTFVIRIPPGRTLDIFNHERNRPHYPTAFVVSAPAQDTDITGLYLFLNSIRNEETGLFSAGVIHDSLESPELPHYFPSRTSVLMKNTVQLPNNLVEAFAGSIVPFYRSFIYTPIDESIFGKMPSGFTEVRFFPTVRSIWDETWIKEQDTLLPMGRYLAVSVGYQPRNTSDPDFQNLVSQATSIFPGISTPDLRISSDEPFTYIRGIATLDVEMVGSIDPNELEIKQICPIGSDKYKVTMRMQVCNEGYMHQDTFPFSLFDRSSHLSKPEFPSNAPIVFVKDTTNGWVYQWNVFLDRVTPPGEDGQEDGDPCTEVEFTVTTNWAGVQMLAEGRALELCVTFTHANPKCQFNFATEEGEPVTEADGYKCGDPNRGSSNCMVCCLPIYITLALVVIILILLIWIAWMLKRKLYK